MEGESPTQASAPAGAVAIGRAIQGFFAIDYSGHDGPRRTSAGFWSRVPAANVVDLGCGRLPGG